MTYSFHNRADRLKVNPYNLPGIDGCPPMTNHSYWKARFEMEGTTAPRNSANPYNVGTMAFTSWQRGHDYVAQLLELAE